MFFVVASFNHEMLEQARTNLKLETNFMDDIKNILIAWFATVSCFVAFESPTIVSIISAVVLPIIFFTVGKTVDVVLQIYLKNREERRKPEQ